MLRRLTILALVLTSLSGCCSGLWYSSPMGRDYPWCELSTPSGEERYA